MDKVETRNARFRKKGRFVSGVVWFQVAVFFGLLYGCLSSPAIAEKRIRFATFNVAMNRHNIGQLALELHTRDNKQARQIAEIIQRVRPDVLLLNEFDFDSGHKSADLFQRNYLEVGQGDQEPIKFEHRFLSEVNTGVPSGFDLDNDGATEGPGDAFGYGLFPGQYGMLVFSRFHIQLKQARTFQKFLWKDMTQAVLPQTDGRSFYAPRELDVLRLSSKSHWDLPIKIGDRTVHFLCAHPTPPVFDGPEDRNGLRNHAEIRFWADYIDPSQSGYIYDDRGIRGGLPPDAGFIIAGDMNADPIDGDSWDHAIQQLLTHRFINSKLVPASRGASEKSVRDGGANSNHRGMSSQDTSDFNDRGAGNLRLDYLLPGRSLMISDSAVFWPALGEAGYDLVDASDHRLVWIDIALR